MGGDSLFFRADRISARYFSAWGAVRMGLGRFGIMRARAKDFALWGRTARSISPVLRWRWKSSGRRRVCVGGDKAVGDFLE